MHDYCRTHPYNMKPNPPIDLRFIVVDDENKIIYCTVPKVATSTWKRILGDLRGLKQGINIHRWDLWRRLYQYTEEERTQRLQTYFKFVFVREPLNRLLSAYKNKFIDDRRISKPAREKIIKTYRPQDFEPNGDNNVTFTEFIRYFSNNIPRNQHWRQYEELCHPCVINYDFIGHLETLKDDAPLLLKMAGIDDRVTFPPIHESTGSSEVLEYFSQVPPRYITRLGELYRSDFDMFGYEYLGQAQAALNSSSNLTEP